MADSNNSGNNSGSNSSDSLLLKVLQQYGVTGISFGIAIQLAIDSFANNWLQILLLTVLGILAAVLLSEITKEVFQPIFRRLLYGLVGRAEQTITWLFSPFQRNYYGYLIDTHQRYRTQGLDIPGAVDLGLEQMFIPLRVVPQAYDQIPAKLIQVAEDTKNYTIWDFIAASNTEPSFRRIALIAPPGSGKTILLKHLTLTYAKNAQRQQNRRAPRLIPILLHLREMRHDITRGDLNLVELIECQPTIRDYNPPKRWFEKKLTEGQCLVMLDGLDEVPDEQQRQQVSQWIDKQIRTYLNSRFIITSRPLSFQTAPVTEVRASLKVKPFGFDQMEQFVYNWYLQNDSSQDPLVGPKTISRSMRRAARRKTADLMSRIKKSSSLAELALNPLLLTMITTVDDYSKKELPLHRAELFDEIYDVLLVKRQDARGIYDEQLATQTKQVLQLLALDMMQRNATEFKLSTSPAPIHRELQKFLGNKTLKDLLQRTDSASGLLIEVSPDTYAFAHQSIQDYLAAVQIKETDQTRLITENLDQQWWFETIYLYAVRSNDATAIVQETIRRSTAESLTLASILLQDDVSMDENVRQQLRQTLDEGLKHSNPQISKLAAQVKLGNRLRQLHPVDGTQEIDLDYVSHAEYQLFLDAQPTDDPFYPDHWQNTRFSPELASAPIAGLRGTDARAFCDWLNQAYPSSNPTMTFRYRLPTATEAIYHLAHDKQMGGWCVRSGRYVLEGVGKAWWEQWQRNLSTRVEAAVEGDRQFVRQLINDNHLDLSLDHSNSPIRVTLDPTLDLDKVIKLAPDLNLNHAYSLIHSRALSKHVQYPSLVTLERNVQIIRRQLPSSRRLLDRSQLDQRSFQEVRAHLLIVTTLWATLANVYHDLTEQRQQTKFLPASVAQLFAYSHERVYQNCKRQRDRTFTLYAFLILLDERRSGSMPAWEGIRIVREKIQH
jgi:hypothetical protein